MGYQMIYQLDEEGCSLAALEMALCAKSKSSKYRHIYLKGHPPYTLKELQAGAKELGYGLEFFHVAEGEEIAYPETKRTVFLAILKSEGKSGHMVLVRRITSRRVYISDPAEGEISLRKSEFQERWTGVYGTLVQVGEALPPEETKVVNPSWSAASVGLIVMNEALLFLGFSFMKEDSYMISIVFFAVFALFEILRELFSVYCLKKFDEKWLPSTYDDDPKRFRGNYERYNRFKKGVFAGAGAAVSYGVLALALTLLVGVNAPSFFAAAAIEAAFVLVFAMMAESGLKKKRASIEKAEDGLFRRKGDQSEKVASLKELSDLSTGYGTRLVYMRTILTAAAFALAFLPSAMSGNVALNYYLFHFFALLSVSECFGRVVSYVSDEAERSSDEGYFYEYFVKSAAYTRE